jgi:hypothetical protein
MADLGQLLWGRGNADKMQDVYDMEEGTPWSANATDALIDNLKFEQSKTVRTSTMILAAFNILAAFLTASSILYDCYWASKRVNGGKAKSVKMWFSESGILTSTIGSSAFLRSIRLRHSRLCLR